jgi:hypothetical protein
MSSGKRARYATGDSTGVVTAARMEKWVMRNKGSPSPWGGGQVRTNRESVRTSAGGGGWRMGPYYR